MIDITRLKQVYATLQQGGYNQDFDTFRKGFAGNENYANRKKVYDLLSANGAQIGKTYEEFMQNMQKPKSMGNPTVNKYRQQMFKSVDPTKNKASELTRKAVKTAHKAMDNVRKPVRGAVVNKQGKKVKEFDITPAKTIDDLNREYAQEVTSDWEKEQQRQSLYNTTRSLDEVQRKIAERDAQLDEADNGFWTGIRHAAQGMNVTGGIFQQYDDDMRKELIDPKYKQYLVEANYLTQMKKQLIQEEEDAAAPNVTKWDKFKHASSSFTSGMLDEAFGSDAFDFGGYNKMRESDVLLRINDRINRGVATDDDRRLLQILKDKEEVESRLDNDAYSFGRGASQSAGFVTDFLITGGGDFGGLGRLGGKMALGLARKTFAKTMTKDLGKRFAAWSLKNLGKTLGEATGAAMTATSVQVGKTAANATQRYLGLDSDDGGLEYDKEGNLRFKGGTDVGTAIAKAIASGTIENYTELLGPHITSMGKRLFGWAGVGLEKITPDALSRFFDKVGSSELFKRIGTFTDEIANSKVLNAGKKSLAKVGVNDMPEEGLEEEAGIILNSLITGDNKFSDLWDKETQYKTWGGVMSMMGAMRAIPIARSAVGTAYSASKNKVEYFKCKHDLTKAETLARQALGNKWTPIKELIDNADNKHIIEVGVNIIRQSDKYSQEQAKAAQMYIGQLLKMRGFNNATMASIRDKNAKGEELTDADKKDIEVSNAYAEGHEAEGELRHLIQLEYEKRTANLAKRLGLTPEKIEAMNVDSFSSYIGLNSDADFDIFQYKKAKAAYDGVMDNAQNLVDIAGEVAAHRVDNMTNVHDGTIMKAFKKGTESNPDSPVYIISGNIELNDDGSINYTDSDKMIVVYDEETGQREAIGNFMLASVDPNMQNAEEVKAQAIQEAKQKIITEQSNVIDGILAEGSEFTMESNDGSSHNYKIVQVDEQGNCIVSVDGTVLPEPLSLDAIQRQYDQSNIARSVKNDQTAQESEQTTQEPEQIQQEYQPIEDKFDYAKITNVNDGKVKSVVVTDEEGNNRFPNAKAVFLIQDKGAMPKFVVMDEEGNLTSYVGKRGDKIRLMGEKTVGEYKKQRQEELQMIAAENANSSMIEDNSGTIEADRGGIEVEDNTQPLSEADADNVIAQMESSAEVAPELELTPDNWVVEFGEDGIVSTPIGDVKMGENQVAKLFEKGRSKEFGMIKPTLTNPDVIIEVPSHSADGNEERSSSYLFIKTFLGKNGEKVYYFKSVTIKKDGLEISISSHYDRAKRVKEALMKGKLLYRKNDGAQTEQNQPSASVTTSQEDAAGSSENKDTNISANGNENNESLTFEDGTPIPVDANGETDLSQTDAAHAAEWYDNNLGEDADDWLDGEIKKVKKVLEQAKNKKLTGTKPSELVASKKEKEAAIADAQAHYDSAISIRDSLKERRIAKEENTADGRKNLIEKARRKFSRLKSAVKDDAEAESQLYKDVVGSLLHRLYDGTGIDVTDTIPLTAEEYVASNLGAHSLNYEGTETSKGVKQETGLSREDFAKTQLLAADGKGTTIDDLVHSLWENRPSNLESLDTQDIRNALIGVLNSGFKASEARNYIENLRIAQAENILEEQKKAADNAAFAEEQKVESEQQTETAPESEEKTEVDSSDEINDEENEQTNAPEQNKFPDKLKEGSETVEVPEDATDEKPLGEQRTDSPFSAKKNGKQQTEAERAADVEKNKVDDIGLVDAVIGEKIRKSFERIAKMMGAKIQYQRTDKLGNGWIQETTDADGNVHRTIFITLDSSITEGAQFIFGHEMTHQIKNLNPAAYNELTQLVLDTYGSDAFDKAIDETMKRYSDAGFSGRARDYYAEEVVADSVGEMIRDLNLAHTLAMKMSHPLLAAIHEILQKIKLAFFGTEYSDVTKNIIRSIEQAYVKTANGEVTNSETGEDVSFSLRQKPEPKKKGIGYKVFVLKDGKLYPPMVANPDGAATPVGVWLDADAAPIAGESKTGRPQVKQGGKGTQGGSGKLAYRPGWHLGVVPYAIQFNRKDADGNKTLFPKNFVFAEVEYAADVDYQEEARQEGINPSGKYQHSLAGLKHLPTDGYYMYRTNPNPETDPWVITGAMKVNRILTRAEQADLVSKAGREPQQIQEGDIVTDDVVNSINQEIAAAPKFSLKVYHGSGADFTEFDFDHMGEGAGSQAFGWGGYVTSSKKIGKSYANLVDANAPHQDVEYVGNNAHEYTDVVAGLFNGGQRDYDDVKEFLQNGYNSDKDNARKKQMLEWFESTKPSDWKSVNDGKRNLYEVDIPEDNGSNYLDWDAPLTDKQKNTIIKELRRLKIDFADFKKRGFSFDGSFGGNSYDFLMYALRKTKKWKDVNASRAVSKFLSSLGYTGIKYKAGRNFGGAEEGDTNYVIFKPQNMRITEHTKFSLKDPFKMSDNEKKERGDRLIKAPAIDVASGVIQKTDELSARKAAEKWWNENIEQPLVFNTEIGDVVIDDKSIKDSLAHKYNQAKLDSITSLPAGFGGSVYLGTISDFVRTRDNVQNHYFAYPINYDGQRSYVFCRAMQDTNKNRLYVHEVFVADKINEGNTLQTAASKPHGGIALYKEILANVLSAAKIDNSSETAKENGEKVGSEGIKFSLKDEKIKSIAEKFGVNEDDVAMYANAVERGSTAEAARARANIKRYLLQANEDKISSFKDIIKYTKPINEALKENFGDLDAMIEERRKQVEAQRNAMEAARKRAQEEEEKRQKHLDELSLIPTDELDKRYMDAIANNDESTAREMLDESARRKGYGDADSDYQGQGAWAAPSNPQYESDEARRADIENSPDVNLEDIALGYNLQPDDYFDNPRAYMNNTAYGLESAHVIKNALDAIKNGEKDVKVKVYRAVPTSVKEGKLRNGDWVTPSKKYAEMHGDNRLDGKYRIIEDEVPANQLWWDGNDANEFGFDDGKEYRYKNAKNNRKLNDLITYDNKGNVIPPSKRFNSRKSDIRFSLKEEKEKIVTDAKANGTYMTAPNGEKTKLNAEQWATVRTANFKNWFGDWENDPENASKVVDENGEPMVVWHGRSAEFNTFEKKEGVRFIMGIEDKVKAEGFFFSPDKGLAEEFASNSSRHRGGKANVVPCFLNIRRPMDLTGEDYDRIYEDVTGWEYMVGMDTQDNLWGIMDEEGMADKIKEKGYDGAIFVEEVDDSYEPTKISYCALDANQIKSAENNNGDFSADNNDIRFSLKSMMAKPEGWKQANKKAIHIAEAIERDPKFSLKNLDGTLIKAGTYFSGGGLVEEGLKGIIDPVVAVEYDEKISGVYRNNFGQHIVTADVRDVDPKELVKQIDGEVEYFHASPVCKNYSQAKSNHAEVELDKETAASTAEFVNAVKPKVVTIENVKGYKDSDAMKIITDALDANGYTWDANVYNAADYGGYTNRERLIVRAVRDGKLPEKPKKMAHKSGWYEAVADIIPTLTEKKNGVAPWMDIRLKADGIDWRNIDKPLYVMGSAYADGKVPHAFADELLPTLRTKSGDVIVMPDGKVYRAMGRVLARVSGVSDDYKMPFSENLSHTIIGNGIPTQLTEHVIAPLLTGSDPKFSIRTYHGTGASFDKFDLSHALEGEGSESFGHGVYVTNSSKIGREYAQRAKNRKMEDLYKNMRYPDGVKGDIFKRRVFGEMVNDVATGGSVASAKEFAKKRVGADANDIQRTLENLKDREKGTEYEQNLKDRLAEYKEGLKWIDSLDEDYLTQGNSNRYDVDIPDDNGSNYLDWEGTIPDSLDKQKVAEDAYKVVSDNQGFNDFKATPLNDFIAHTLKTYVNTTDVAGRVEKLKSDIKDVIENYVADEDVLALNEYLKDATPDDVLATIWYNDLVKDIKDADLGEELYRKLSTYVGDNAASQILSDNGLVGIKYPAGLIHGGAKEGDYNYVIFDENNANIVGNTRFSLRGSTPYDKQMEEWKEKNHLDKDAAPMEKPIKQDNENIFDYMNRMVEWTRNQNLWKTAPKQTGFQDALAKWKADNGLSPDAYPPVRPHRENYSTEIGYTEDLEEYNKKKELWKSAPKPKDFDLSVDLEDMNKQIRNIRRAVLNQKNYDQRTVKAVSDLVRKMLNIGWGDGLSRGKVGNLLSAAKNATGVNDVKKYLDKAMGILAENYLNRLSTAYDNLINTKGARADQSGVIKMGSLDAKGQAFMSEYKKAINMDDSSLNTYIANIEEDSAKNEDNMEMNDYRLAGIQAAIMYKQQIGGNDADISELKRQIGELKNKKDATKEDKDLLKSLEKKLFENKFDRITMYENLLNNIQRMVKESKGRAKEFREEITEHKNEILHLANLDLEGVDSSHHHTQTWKKKFWNNPLFRFVMSSTYTFEQFLKYFGRHHANGDGYLYNYFMSEWHDAADEQQLYNEMNRNALDEKTKELFGKKKFMKLVGIDGKGMKEMDIDITDYSNKETGKRTIHLKQGQMLYIYLVNKETDGEMKLRAMGITEEDVAAIEANLDPRVKAMGEWLQDEYLPECQRRYQATHTKYFGAPMKEVENYFPLAIDQDARNQNIDINQNYEEMSRLAGTSTGAIVTRRVNVIPLDIENADAFAVAFNHLDEMEEWSAYLPFKQDINTLLSYTHFKNQVKNMSSAAYGNGETLWKEFMQTAQIAAGTYRPKVDNYTMDGKLAALAGGIATAKISGRLWTAIKQSQSATVFLPECDFGLFVKNSVKPYGSYKWAKENLPLFRKRIEGLTIGDMRIKQFLDDVEKYHDWAKAISKFGMSANILVDSVTCAVGARSVYETELKKLTKLGYSKEKAEEKALLKASLSYNKTQQSSEGAFLSPMQVDRTYVSAALSLFKNANYAYGRGMIEACRGLAKTYDLWGGKHKITIIESMTRQIMREDGLDESIARAIARKSYYRTFRKSIGMLLNYLTLVPVSWAAYKVLPYLLTGDDDDKKQKMIEDAVLKGFSTSITDNYVIPFLSNGINAAVEFDDNGSPTLNWDKLKYQNLYINPATSDLANIYSMVANQKWYAVGNKIGMLGVQSLIGFNPETLGALYQLVSEGDFKGDNTNKEVQISVLKAISAPEESIRELYMDELGLNNGDKDVVKKFMSKVGLDGDDITKIPLSVLEQRYAERQINRDNLLSQIFMPKEDFDGYVEKYKKSFEKKIQEKMDKMDAYDQRKFDAIFDTTTDPALKGMMEKKRANDANAAADEQIAKEGLNQEKNGKEPSEEAYDAVKMSIDVAEDNAISTYNKVLNKRYAALNDEYNNQTDAMEYIFMSKHPNFKAYKDLKSEYTTYGKKIKELKEKLVSADGYDAKQTILKQIRAERDKFYELQSKVR